MKRFDVDDYLKINCWGESQFHQPRHRLIIWDIARVGLRNPESISQLSID